jgi:hypothetical protein
MPLEAQVRGGFEEKHLLNLYVVRKVQYTALEDNLSSLRITVIAAYEALLVIVNSR